MSTPFCQCPRSVGTIAFMCEATRGDFALDLPGSELGFERGTWCPSATFGENRPSGALSCLSWSDCPSRPCPFLRFSVRFPGSLGLSLQPAALRLMCFFLFFLLFPEEPEMRPNKVSPFFKKNFF